MEEWFTTGSATAHPYDPALAKGLATLSTAQPLPSDLAEARRVRTEIVTAEDPADLTDVEVRDVSVPGGTGSPDVLLRTYRPAHASARTLPCLFTIYGGGFMFGSVEDTHARNARWCRELGAVIVAVNYRLAPENPYPAALDDCYTGFSWCFDSADVLGIDLDRIALHGTSAGAGLAAAITLQARDRGGPRACFQFLGVPELDDRLDTVSSQSFLDTPVWNRPNAIRSWDSYLGKGVRGTDSVPKYAAPARETDLSGLPRAYISVMEFDPLRDEGVAYAQRLLAAGVSVELHLFPRTFHSSYRVADAEVSRRELDELMVVLRRELSRGGE